MPNSVSETEVTNFLASKLNIQIATIDEDGYPMIQPIWFLFNKESDKIYIATQKMTKKGEILIKYTFQLMIITIHTRE